MNYLAFFPQDYQTDEYGELELDDLGNPILLEVKKFLNLFCFACTLGLLPCLCLHKAKRVQLNGKTLKVLKKYLATSCRDDIVYGRRLMYNSLTYSKI